MLEYTKTIMQKVSFSKFLLQKEFGKAMDWLNQREQEELTHWMRLNFGHEFDDRSNKVKEACNW